MKRLAIVFAAAVSLCSQAWAGHVRSTSQSVPLDDAASVQVRIEFGAGRFELGRAARGQLLEGTFETDVEELEALVNYRRRGDRGLLDLSMEQSGPGLSGHFKNEWAIGLAEGVPLDLEFDLGAVEATLDLSGLSIAQLQLDVGAADCEVLWDKPNPERLTRLDVHTGVSSLRMEGLGHAGFERLRFEGGLGDFELDFSGDWQHGAEADFEIGLGELTLWVPPGIGVRIETDKALASVKADRHFLRDDDLYVSENYDDALIKLDCTVELGMGSLVVKTLPDAAP
jgi:hypothetical protein